MEVHRQLGAGFLEIVYKDALEIEFGRAGISFEREKEYKVSYKGSHYLINSTLILWCLIQSF